MDGVTHAELRGVVAPLNFMVPMAEKPYSYNYDPPPGVPARNGQLIEYNITIHDARPVNDELSLDHEGFVLRRHQTAAADLYDETVITSVYYPECERLMREATGARRVVAFDHIVRNAAKAAIAGSSVKTPAGRVHNDYTAWSAPQRVRDLMGDEAEELLKHRLLSTMSGGQSPVRCCARLWPCATPRLWRSRTSSLRNYAIPTAPERLTRLPTTQTSAGTIFQRCRRRRRY